MDATGGNMMCKLKGRWITSLDATGGNMMSKLIGQMDKQGH